MKFGIFKAYLGFAKLRGFLGKVKMRPLDLAPPVIFSVIASGFEAIGIALMTPMLQGFLGQGTTVHVRWPVIGTAVNAKMEMAGSNPIIFNGILAAMVVGAMSLKSISVYLSQITLAYQARRMNDNLRRALMDRYLRFGKLYYDATGVGHLLQILMTHPVRIIQSLEFLNGSINSIFLMIVYTISLLMISWKLTLIVALAFPILLLSQKWILTKIRRSSDLDTAVRAGLNQKTVNILSGIPLIQAQCAEAQEQELYARLSDSQRLAEYSIDKKRFFVQPFNEVMGLMVLLAILIGMSFLMTGYAQGSAAKYAVYFFILRRIMNSVQVFNRFGVEMAAIAAPIREVTDVFDDENKPFVSNGPTVFTGLERSIKFNHLNFGYDRKRTVLKDVSFLIPKGGMTALVGPSGAGKSTIIQLLLRFYDCPADTILIDGCDIRSYTRESLRAGMAWVSQETHLFNDTLRANILFGLNRSVDDAEMHDVLRRSRLQNFVDKLPKGLETLIGDRGVNLSGGEKQRVSIARAILKGSHILLLDEATSALDSVTESEIQAALDDLIAGQTAIVVAHRLSTIRNATHVIYMENESVCEDGPLQDLLALKGRFYGAWQAQKFL